MRHSKRKVRLGYYPFRFATPKLSVRKFESPESFMDCCTDSWIHESKYGHVYEHLEMILQNHSWMPAQIDGYMNQNTVVCTKIHRVTNPSG